MSSRSTGAELGTPESRPCWSSFVSFVMERSIGGIEAMDILSDLVPTTEGFYDTALNEANDA